MKARFTVAAAEEVFEIARHYAAHDRILGSRFLNRLDDSLATLAANPNVGALVAGPFRRLLLQPFPYTVYYRVDSQSDSIWIEAVVHQKRRGRNWQSGVQEESAIYASAA